MADWVYAQERPEQRLARLHHFSTLKKATNGDEVELFITIREFVTPRDPAMRFFATADRAMNQSAAPFAPSGWGDSLIEALTMCLRNVDKFPLEA